MIWVVLFMVLALMLLGVSVVLAALGHPLWIWSFMLGWSSWGFGAVIRWRGWA